MTKTKEELTPDAARQLLTQERIAREQKCQKEIQAVLDKHGCQLVAQPTITQDGRLAARIVLVSRTD
jgi:arginine repressor